MAITFPHVGDGSFAAAQGSLTASWNGGGSTAAGSMIAVGGGFDPVASGVTLSTTGGAGGGAVTDSGLGIINDTNTLFKCYVKAFLAPASGVTSVTATYSGTNPTYGDLAIWEIAGLTNPVFDKAVTAAGNSGTADSGATGTLSASAEGAIGFGNTAGGFSAASGAWTLDFIIGGTGSISEHQILSSNASIDATGTLSSNFWRMFCATFMSSSGAAQTPYQPYFQQMLASKRKSMVGWREGYDHRWRRWRRVKGIIRAA